VKSSARRLGAGAPRAIGGFYLATLALALAACTLARLQPGFALIFIAFAVHLGLQARRVKVDDPVLALKLFKSNAWAGVLLFAAIAMGSVSL